ncbi:MAG: response regulator transcription factor [Anaerolineaceae bacterium]|nr:response regulator transcription factor [Anaerolineaceae bacterium]
MGKPEIRVLVVDDHPIVRSGLCTQINLDKRMVAVGEAKDGVEAVDLARQIQPDVILMDIVMPRKNGIEAITEIIKENPAARILVLTSFTEDEKIYAAIKAGAMGYILKDHRPEDVLEAIVDTFNGKPHLNPNITKGLFRELRQQTETSLENLLTARELEVLRWIAQGVPNKEIARSLGVSESTIFSHVSHILGKLNLSNRSQLALYAVRHGLFKEPSEDPESFETSF